MFSKKCTHPTNDNLEERAKKNTNNYKYHKLTTHGRKEPSRYKGSSPQYKIPNKTFFLLQKRYNNIGIYNLQFRDIYT